MDLIKQGGLSLCRKIIGIALGLVLFFAIFSYELTPENSEDTTEPQIIYVVKTIQQKQKKPVYIVSSSERELLARLVYTEARGESLECQKGVVSVVFNRIASTGGECSVEEIINAKGQFDMASELWKVTPLEEQYLAVDYVIENGSTMPDWVLYCRSERHHSWSAYEGYTTIDKTYFGGYRE